jgi:hypothetical protein
VRVVVGVERRGDRDPLAVVDRGVGGDRAQDRLGVGPREVAQPVGDARQYATVAHPVQQLLGTQRAGGEDHLVRGEAAMAPAAALRRLGRPGVDGVAAAGQRAYSGHGGERMHLRPALLGEIEVVLHQGVLGVVPAPGHALPARPAGVARRPGTTEVRVFDPLAGAAAEEHAHRRGVERVGDAHLVGDLLHYLVGGGPQRVLDHAQHPFGLVEVRRELGTPVGDVAPRGVVVERVQRLVQRVGIDQRAATDTRARQDQAVLEHVDPLDAVHPQRRREQELPGLPRRRRQVVVLEPGTGLQHADAVALLGEPQGGDAAPEPRADHQHVVVAARGRSRRRLLPHGRPDFFSTRSVPVSTRANILSLMPPTGAIGRPRCVATVCDSV